MKHLYFFAFLLCSSLISTAQVPTITSIAPANGPIGTTTTLNGSNFSTTAANNIVYFGPVRATVSAATSSTLTLNVPIGTNYKPVTVLANNLIGSSKNPFVLTNATGGQNFSNTSFASTVAIGGGSSIIEADFDLDGKIDVASTRFTTDLVVVGRNTSVGGIVSFTSTNFFGAVNPIAIKAADINNDGLLDLIVAGSTFNAVYVFKNISTVGNINFDTRIGFGAGAEPRKLTTGDIDNDGKIDVITSNQSGNSISVLRNTSTGTAISFAAKVDFATAATPEGICIGDMDNDGKIDVLVACSGSSAVSLLKNTSTVGTIAFNARIDYGTGSFPWEVVAADMDNDGKLDIISSNTGPNTVSVIRNTTTTGLSFATKIDYGTSFSPRGLVINDLDTDGKPDIITVNSSSSSEACVLKNTSTTGSLNFNTYVSYPVGGGAVGVAVADFNSDGLADIMTANSVNNNGSLSYLKNQLPINTGVSFCSQLLFPANNAVNVAYGLPILMKWRKEINAAGYQLTITPTIGSPTTVNTTDTSYSFTPTAGNVYTWSATPLNLAAGNTCTSFTFTTCTLIANNTSISTPNGNTPKCVGDSTLIQASTSSNIQWFLNDQLITGATADFLWAKQSGNYTVRISNSGCYSAPTNSITINNLATPNKPSLSANGPTTFCSNTSVTLSSSVTNATNQWYKNNLAITNANTNTYSVTTTGNYYIKVSDANTGCSTYSDTMNFTVNTMPATPTASIITGTSSFCQGQSIKLGSSASVGNQWFLDNFALSGATGIEYIATSMGIYTVKATQNGCTTVASNAIPVNVIPLVNPPILSIVSGTTPFCNGDSLVLTSSVTTIPNKWFKNGVAITGASNSTYTVLEAGQFTATITFNGCESANSTPIITTVNPLPVKPTILVVGNTLTANTGYATYKWFLNNVIISGSITNQHIATQSGNYKVEVTDNTTTNCKNTSDVVNLVVTAVNNVTIDGNTIKVYPNPVKENLNIDVTGGTISNSLIRLTVINSVGKKIATISLKQGNNKLNVKEYADGIYQLIIQKGNVSKMLNIVKLN
jgi:FG-GAP-like repeat/Secretion system C-terminal sorting domain